MPNDNSSMRQPSEAALLLASASPRRAELLGTLLDDYEVRPAGIDESQAPGEAPETYVQWLAGEKALAIGRMESGRWVIGSDTVVVLDGHYLGKPVDAGQARAMLRAISGRSHRVYSAVALLGPDGACETALSVTDVYFATLPETWIMRYVDSGEPMDKAGAYAIQGGAAAWIVRIEGSYSGVVGLPLYETAALLRAAGLL